MFLKSFWKHIEGFRVIREEGNFLAADGFNQLGSSELESSSRSLAALSKANIEIRNYNFNKAIDLLNDNEKYLKDSGRFANKFQPAIDHLKPDALFLGALPTLLSGDVEAAKPLFTQASAAYEKVAERYYKEGTQPHCAFLGMGQLVLGRSEETLGTGRLPPLPRRHPTTRTNASQRPPCQLDSMKAAIRQNIQRAV